MAEDTPSTRQQLLEHGKSMLLRHGYHDLGLTALLEATAVPKGSFYHHFGSKEEFGLQVVDFYMQEVHAGLDLCLEDEMRPPLDRVRRFFELSERKYREEGYLGCLLGGLGQELSGVSEVFRRKVEECFAEIAVRISRCLALAVTRGDLPRSTDTRAMADLLVNCWEGAALRARLLRRPAPLRQMLDFYFQSASASVVPRASVRSPTTRAASVRAATTKGLAHDRASTASGPGGHRRRRRRAS
jgi:TetR/AcrR family transcriptional regulator, transcriptional repressor for nem operon